MRKDSNRIAIIVAASTLMFACQGAFASQHSLQPPRSVPVVDHLKQIDPEITETGLVGEDLASYGAWLEGRRNATPAMTKLPRRNGSRLAKRVPIRCTRPTQ